MSDTKAEDADQPAPRIYKVLLMILPVGVVLGTIVFMFMYFYLEREEEKNYSVIVSHGIRVSDLEDMVDKFTNRIGERAIETEVGRSGLRKAASMIAGRLGPQNVGYPITMSDGQPAHGRFWRSLSVEILGETKPQEILFVAVSYAGAGEDADANTVSTVMMLASSMARENPSCTVRFVFMPFDDSTQELNQWLLTRCLMPGESCLGIIGLKSMDDMPSPGDSGWQISTHSSQDLVWWNSLQNEQATLKQNDDVVPTVWLTHAVFSSKTWIDQRAQRLESTLVPAQELRKWLVKASE